MLKNWNSFIQLCSLIRSIIYYLADEADLEARICKLLHQSPLGEILEAVEQEDSSVEQEDKEGLVSLYLSDFIHMVYKPKSDNPQMELEVFVVLLKIT